MRAAHLRTRLCAVGLALLSTLAMSGAAPQQGLGDRPEWFLARWDCNADRRASEGDVQLLFLGTPLAASVSWSPRLDPSQVEEFCSNALFTYAEAARELGCGVGEAIAWDSEQHIESWQLATCSAPRARLLGIAAALSEGLWTGQMPSSVDGGSHLVLGRYRCRVREDTVTVSLALGGTLDFNGSSVSLPSEVAGADFCQAKLRALRDQAAPDCSIVPADPRVGSELETGLVCTGSRRAVLGTVLRLVTEIVDPDGA